MQNEYAGKEIAYKALLEDSALVPTADDIVFMDSIAQANMGTFKVIEDLEKENDLSQAQVLNSNIVHDNIMEYYKKEFNTIYLNTLATDTIQPDSIELSILNNLSELNAMENGVAVYWARSVTKSLKEDDYNNLRKGKFNNLKPVEIPDYNIFPNPAQSTITISSNNINVNIIEYIIYDITGKAVIKSNCQLNELKCEIDISRLLNGFYLIKISSYLASTYIDNLIIIH